MINEILDIAASPLWELASLSSRAFVLYFVSYAAIAFLLYRRRGAAQGFANFLFPPEIYAQGQFLRDALYFCFISAFAYACGGAIAAMVSPDYMPYEGEGAAYLLRCLGGVLLFDFLMFATHYAQHKIGGLWHFHRLHHAPEKLHFLIAFKHHPVDILLISVALALTYAAFPQPEVNVFLVAYYLAGYHFRHSHIPLEYPSWLRYILVSPSDHQWHHRFNDGRNLGFIFSFWDRLAGTYAVRPA